MTTNRMIQAIKTSNNILPLKEVQPTKSILLMPMPCEIKTAGIRNKTVEYMKQNDIAGVAYKYLQTKKAEKNTFFEASLYSAVTILLIYMALQKNPRNLVLALIPLVYVLANISNTRRYGETQTACEKWLKNRIESKTFQEIKKFSYRKDLIKMINLLKEENINVSTIEPKVYCGRK